MLSHWRALASSGPLDRDEANRIVGMVTILCGLGWAVFSIALLLCLFTDWLHWSLAAVMAALGALFSVWCWGRLRQRMQESSESGGSDGLSGDQ